MKNSNLCEYLRGNIQESEVMSLTALPLAAGAHVSHRQERLSAAWQDFMVKIEALWLDVLELDAFVYEKAEQTLKELRNTPYSDCKSAVSYVKTLIKMLEEEADDDSDFGLCLSRMEYLSEELEYIIDVFDPDRSVVPGMVIQTKREWLRKKKKEGADLTFVDSGKKASPSKADRVQEPWKIAKDQESKKKEKKPKKEVKESTSVESSVILSAFAKLSDKTILESGDLGEEFLEAGKTIAFALEEFSDVESSYVQIGSYTPGSEYRIDLYCEWMNGDRLSDCYGYARIKLDEMGLGVYDTDDELKVSIPMEGPLTDQDIVEAIYHNLSFSYDNLQFRFLSENRVLPTLHRLMERVNRGETIPESAFSEVLSSLRSRLSLEESVRVVPQNIRLCEGGFEDLYNYYFAWSVEGPDTDTSADELTITVEQPELTALENRNRSEFQQSWKTCPVTVDIFSEQVFIDQDGEKTVFESSMSDRDFAEAIANTSMQVWEETTGYIIE